jgi:hypothetical protein
MREAHRVTGLHKVFEVADLPSPVAWLDAYAGTIISILQAPPEHRRLQSPVRAPGMVCLHDPVSLRPHVVDRPTGWIRRARLSRTEHERLAVCSWPLDAVTGRVFAPRSRVDVWDLSATSRSTRTFEQRVEDAVPWRDRVVLGGEEKDAWGPNHGAKLRVWTASLEACVDELRVRDAGFDVVAAGNVVAATGIDLHLWWPDRDAPAFSLHESTFAPPGEMGPCAISDDGAWVAVCCDRWRAHEHQVMLLRSDDLASPPVLISDDTTRNAAQVSIAPDGSAIAVSLSESPCIRVHRMRDGRLLGETMVPGQRAIAWLDTSRLLIGGDALSVWSLDS